MVGPDQPTKTAPMPKCAARGMESLYVFMPQEGITVAELVASVEVLVYGVVVLMRASPPAAVDQLWEKMDAATRRHWRRQELPKQSGLVAPVNGRLQLPPGAR